MSIRTPRRWRKSPPRTRLRRRRNTRPATAYTWATASSCCPKNIRRDTFARWSRIRGQADRGGWPCWAFSNHDVRRVVTRWGGEQPSNSICANQLIALLCSLRGSVCLYQGEELGLSEAGVPFESLRDPYGIAFWPNFKGRDGCRTPMPWNGAEHAGFSTARSRGCQWRQSIGPSTSKPS